jgi:protein-tyrosine phosphatase
MSADSRGDGVDGGDGGDAPALTGAFNFRDLGGLPAADAGRTRLGRLFRSDTLQALTESDVAHLVRSLGVMLVVDLRDADEAVEQGRGLLGRSPLCYVNLPLEAAPAAGPAPASAGGATLDFYLSHLESASSALPLALQILAVSLGRPAVVHCAAGKDRTGLVVALALGIAGVTDEAIVADYMATAHNMPRINERFQTWPRYRAHMAAADPELYRVQEQPIRAFLRELAQRYGGARGWARHRGIPEPLLNLLADRLLEPRFL